MHSAALLHRRPTRALIAALWAIGALAIGGCARLEVGTKSPLTPARMSDQSVVVDIFSIKMPITDRATCEAIWAEVDEQRFDIEIRQQLKQEGFRAGIVGLQLPAKLEQLMDLQEAPPPSDEKRTLTEIMGESAVARRHIQSPPGRRHELHVSGVYSQLPVFRREAEGLTGKPYPNAQCMLAMRVWPETDGRVKMELLPELHYGELRQNIRGTDGGYVVAPGRPKEAFPQLRLESLLSAGQSVLLSCDPSQQGSLGYHFFTTEDAGVTYQKLFLLRVSQTQHDKLFDDDKKPRVPSESKS